MKKYPSEYKKYPRRRDQAFNVRISEEEKDRLKMAIDITGEDKNIEGLNTIVDFYLKNNICGCDKCIGCLTGDSRR